MTLCTSPCTSAVFKIKGSHAIFLSSLIQKAIANAKTLEEVERLNHLLQSGQIPGQESNNHHNGMGEL